MKIAIASDFHLGYDRFREDAYKQAEEALGEASKIADMIIIPGDIFDMRAPRPEVLAEAINLFRTLSKMEWKARVTESATPNRIYTDVPIIAIPGTHERRAQGAENPVTLLGLAGLLVDVTNGFAVVQKGSEKTLVYGVGGISEERFLDTLKELNPQPVKGCFNIFMFHQSTQELLPFGSGSARFDDLPLGFDLYVDGHIHNRMEKKVHGKPLLVPGSTVLTQLKDGEQEEKGFYLYDTSANTYSFHKIKSRRFVVVKIDAGSRKPEELEAEIKEEIEKAVGSGRDVPIVKVEIDGKLKKGLKSIDIDFQEIARAYQGRAIVEIAKPGVEEIELDADIEAVRKGSLENMSIKDYGLGIFIEKLRESKYDLNISPSELFDLLSSEASKDKTIKKVLEELFAK